LNLDCPLCGGQRTVKMESTDDDSPTEGMVGWCGKCKEAYVITDEYVGHVVEKKNKK
jgi:uncharacterized protein YbaR (Trm112 family)